MTSNFSVLNNNRGASTWDLVLKVLSITLVSLFAFSSGIWFGKKLSDNDYQRMALEGEFSREVQKSTGTLAYDKAEQGVNSDDIPKEALTDEEVTLATEKVLEQNRKLASVESPAKNQPATTGEAAAPASSTVTSTGAPAAKTVSNAKPDLSAAHQAANRVANNAAPTKPSEEKAKAESRVPSSLPKTVGASADVEFTVQVASYPNAKAAHEHVEAMVQKGFPAFPVEATINGKTWYRVSVGSFKSFNEASKFRAQLLKQADLPSAIVQKITR